MSVHSLHTCRTRGHTYTRLRTCLGTRPSTFSSTLFPPEAMTHMASGLGDFATELQLKSCRHHYYYYFLVSSPSAHPGLSWVPARCACPPACLPTRPVHPPTRPPSPATPCPPTPQPARFPSASTVFPRPCRRSRLTTNRCKRPALCTPMRHAYAHGCAQYSRRVHVQAQARIQSMQGKLCPCVSTHISMPMTCTHV